MTSWADNAIKLLQEGKIAKVKPKGNSMTPKIKSGQEVIIVPLEGPLSKGPIEKGDVVLCKVKGMHYLHYVKAIDNDDPRPPSSQRPALNVRYQIGNAHGHVNGWTTTVYGKVDFDAKVAHKQTPEEFQQRMDDIHGPTGA